MQFNCPAVGICAINKTNNTLIRDNLYEDNTSMNQFFSQRILFCIYASALFVSYAQILRCWGQDQTSIFQHMGSEMFNFFGAHL